MPPVHLGTAALAADHLNGMNGRRPLYCQPYLAALGTVTGEQTSLLTDEPVVDPTYRTLINGLHNKPHRQASLFLSLLLCAMPGLAGVAPPARVQGRLSGLPGRLRELHNADPP